MATFKRFEEIQAWQKARELNSVIGTYIDRGCFKSNFRLIGQLEGSSGSIMDNIAEGFERSGNKEFLQYLYIAKGSSGEFRSQLYRALDRGYMTQLEFDTLYQLSKQVIVLLQGLIDYLEASDLKGLKYHKRSGAAN